MANYYVTKVRKEQDKSDNHEHIVGVITQSEIPYTNAEVVKSIADGNNWYTRVPNYPDAKIKPMDYCPASRCLHKPYLTTEADATKKNNLENLPRG